MSSDTQMGKQTLIGAFVLGGVLLGIFALVAFGNVRFFPKVIMLSSSSRTQWAGCLSARLLPFVAFGSARSIA